MALVLLRNSSGSRYFKRINTRECLDQGLVKKVLSGIMVVDVLFWGDRCFLCGICIHTKSRVLMVLPMQLNQLTDIIMEEGKIMHGNRLLQLNQLNKKIIEEGMII
eukprot:3619773-Ditylum_brightwellii.AAC.1